MNENKTEKNIYVKTFMISCKEVKSDTQKFIASTAKINGKWYKIKFTKDCEVIPRKRGLYDITINLTDVSLEKGKLYTNSRGETKVQNDTLWIKNTLNLRKYTEEELIKRNLESLSDVFEVDSDDDLPF